MKMPVREYEPGHLGPRPIAVDSRPSRRVGRTRSRGWRDAAVRMRELMTLEVLADADSVARHAAEVDRRRGASGGEGPRPLHPRRQRRPNAVADAARARLTGRAMGERPRAAGGRTNRARGHADRNLRTSREPARQARPGRRRSTRCPWNRPTSTRRRCAMRRPSSTSPGRRRFSISSISAWGPTDTPRRWFRAIRCSTSRIPTSRSPASTRDGAG